MKTYILIYQDKKGNELQRYAIQEPNIKSARTYARRVLAVSMINDLRKIRVIVK